MRRREFILALGGAAAWPLAARGQNAALPVVGFLGTASPQAVGGLTLQGFKQGLAETGYIENQNVTIEYRWAEDRYERLPALAAELVQRRVNVLAAPGTAAALPAKAATSTIPIVFMIASDPVKLGLVASLNHPGGNLTGVAYLNDEIAPKRLELLLRLIPTVKSVALLINPTNPASASAQAKEMQQAAASIGVRLSIVHASNAAELEQAFAMMTREKVDALQIGVDPFFGSNVDRLVALAAQHKLPTIYPWREFTAAGGLMNYGTSIPDAFRQVGVYTGQILKGAAPAELPVQRPLRLLFALNLATAKNLGLTVGPELFAMADEIIE
jgi:ABC-type uncharacterized transport system substrate-binding protein